MRLELAFAAFAPVFLLVGLRSEQAWWAWVFYGLSVLGALVMVAGVILTATGNTEEFVLTEIEDASDQILGYIAAYLVPVLIDPSASLLNALVAAASLFLVFVVHVAAGRVHVNPILYLVGYRVYAAKTKTASFALIARTEVADWSGERPLVDLSAGILIEKWKRKPR